NAAGKPCPPTLTNARPASWGSRTGASCRCARSTSDEAPARPAVRPAGDPTRHAGRRQAEPRWLALVRARLPAHHDAHPHAGVLLRSVHFPALGHLVFA